MRLPQIMRTVLDGYAERPALGQRAVRYVEDLRTGRTSAELLPRFDTISYAEVSDRVSAIANALTGVRPGDRVALLGFTSIDYATIDMALAMSGAVSVPLQTSAPAAALQPIVAETEPVVIASAVGYLADAVELALAAPPCRPCSCSITTSKSTTSRTHSPRRGTSCTRPAAPSESKRSPR